MNNFNDSRSVADPEVLRNAVVSKQSGLRPDAPQERLTTKTFPANAGILDWAQRGDLARAVRSYNLGGTVDPHSGAYVSREYYLMRIFDAAEALGRKKFEEFVPGIWDSALTVYRMTFSTKIMQYEAAQDAAPLDPEALYGEGQQK